MSVTNVTNAYVEMMYNQLRRSKMYQTNMRMLELDVKQLLKALKGIKITHSRLRFFYTRWDEIDQSRDLLANYPEKFLVALISYIFTQNYPITIENIFCDANTWIFDVTLESLEEEITRHILKDILTEAPVSFSSHVEVEITTKENDSLRFRLDGLKQLEYSSSLFSAVHHTCFPPKRLDMPISYETLDKYYALLEYNYSSFFADVKDRFCTVWCVREGMGEFIIKRYVNSQPIHFPSTFNEAEPLLQSERMTQIVPNCLPFSTDVPIELCIDIDIPRTMEYSLVKRVTDRLAQWLTSFGFIFFRRLTGSPRGGQHFIIPIIWPKAIILGGKTEVWEVYIRRAVPQILSDSVCAAGTLMSLIFQREHPELARNITTHIFDPYLRHDRLLFDVSSNAWNRGRRAILSLYHTGQSVCVPHSENEIPSKKEDYLDLCSLETILNQQTFIKESPITKAMKEHNTATLTDLVFRNDRLFLDYGSSNVRRFEAQFFNIPIEENYENDSS